MNNLQVKDQQNKHDMCYSEQVECLQNVYIFDMCYLEQVKSFQNVHLFSFHCSNIVIAFFVSLDSGQWFITKCIALG